MESIRVLAYHRRAGRPAGLDKGWYVEPTVFSNVDNSMRIAREEIFGPVVVVIPYDEPADAVRIANDSDYGLSGTVWTNDVDRGLDIARQVRTGTYTVNGFMMDFGSPFGGFKSSGIGRDAKELLRKVKAAQYVAAHPGEVCPAKWNEGEKTLKPGLDLVGKI